MLNLRRFLASMLAAALTGAALAGCGATGLTGAARPTAGFRAASALSDPFGGVQHLQGEALLQALHARVSNQRTLAYDEARDLMFSEVDDPDGDDVVEDVYLGRRLEHVTDRKTAYLRGKGLSAEHVWPQSMGAQTATFKADLHALMPADCQANSVRNNLPYGSVTRLLQVLPDRDGNGKASMKGYDAKGRIVFEPRDERKGDTARAMLYIYTRYVVGLNEAQRKLSDANFRYEHDLLLRWHAEDPVSAEEVAREKGVARVQGNRNPFVLHPELVSMVGSFVSPAGSEDLTEPVVPVGSLFESR